MNQADEIKKITGLEASKKVQEGMTIGIGTGTTAYWCIVELGKRVKEGLSFKAVPTSNQTKLLAASLNIPLIELNEVEYLDLTIDGADEIDPKLQLIKGGGGALLQEKIVASASRQLIIIADSSKLVPQLGAFPLPVEVVPFGWKQVQRRIRHSHQIEVSLRMSNNQPFITDHGNYILDCHFQAIPDATAMSITLNNIPGVVENGLFIGMASSAIIGYPDGSVKVLNRPVK